MMRKSVENTVLLDFLPDKEPIYLILPTFNFSIINTDDAAVQFMIPNVLTKTVIKKLQKPERIKALCLCITDCPVMDSATGCGGLGYYHLRFSMQEVKLVIKKEGLLFTGPKILSQYKFHRPNR